MVFAQETQGLGANQSGCSESAHRNRNQTLRGGAVAELAVIVLTPTLDRAAVQQCAGVAANATGNSDRVHNARDCHRAMAIVVATQAGVTPALNGAAAQHRAGVPVAGSNSHGVTDGSRDGHIAPAR